MCCCFFFQAEDGIRDIGVTGVQTCALPISPGQAAANAPGWNQEYDWNGSFYPDQCAPFSGQCVAFPLSDTTKDKAALTTPPRATTFPAQNKDPMLGIGFVQIFTPPNRDPM